MATDWRVRSSTVPCPSTRGLLRRRPHGPTRRRARGPGVRGARLAHASSPRRVRRGVEGANAWRHHIHELGQDIMYAGTAACVWDVCSWARDWTHGEQVLRESYEMFERMGMNARRSTIAAHLGEAVLHQGRVDEGEPQHRERAARDEDDIYNDMTWRRLRAKVAAAPATSIGLERSRRTRSRPPRCRLSRRGRPDLARLAASFMPRATQRLDPLPPKRLVYSRARAT